MNMVAKGRPEASISSCSAGCKPARAISTPGRTQAVRARASASTITSVDMGQGVGIARRRRDRPRLAGDGRGGEIGGKGHIDRAQVIESLGDQPLGLIGDILRRHHRMGADDRLGHAAEQVIFAVSQRVVHQGARFLDRDIGRADQVKDAGDVRHRRRRRH